MIRLWAEKLDVKGLVDVALEYHVPTPLHATVWDTPVLIDLRSTNTWGYAYPQPLKIRMNTRFTKHAPAFGTVFLHEVAHIIQYVARYPRGHNREWASVMASLKQPALACKNFDFMERAPAMYVYTCACKREWPRHRPFRTTRQCLNCRTILTIKPRDPVEYAGLTLDLSILND